jgi:hypothetical protein
MAASSSFESSAPAGNPPGCMCVGQPNVSIWKQSGVAWCVLNTGLLKMTRSSKHDFGAAVCFSRTG